MQCMSQSKPGLPPPRAMWSSIGGITRFANVTCPRGVAFDGFSVPEMNRETILEWALECFFEHCGAQHSFIDRDVIF